jgi:hypothetical protein
MQIRPSFPIVTPARMMIVLLVLLLGGFGAAPAAASLLISVNKTTQRMAVSLNGRPLWVWPVSTGRASYDTPSGRFTPFRLEQEHYSREWDEAPMPHAIFFTRDGHAIHGTTELRKLGRRASHGCVRLSQANAARLFALVRKHGLGNTRVAVFSEQPAAPAPGLPPAVAAAPLPSTAPPVFGMETGSPHPADFSPGAAKATAAPFSAPAMD